MDGILEYDAGFGGPRQEKSDSPAIRYRVRTEQAERVGVAPREQSMDASVQVCVYPSFTRGSESHRLKIFGRQGELSGASAIGRRAYTNSIPTEGQCKQSGAKWKV